MSWLAWSEDLVGQESRGFQPTQTKHNLGFVLYRNDAVQIQSHLQNKSLI